MLVIINRCRGNRSGIDLPLPKNTIGYHHAPKSKENKKRKEQRCVWSYMERLPGEINQTVRRVLWYNTSLGCNSYVKEAMDVVSHAATGSYLA